MNTYFIIALILGVTIAFYCLGCGPAVGINPAQSQLDKYANLDAQAIFQGILGSIFSLNGLLVGAAVLAVAVISGFNLFAIVPFALMMILFQFMVFPTQCIANGMPAEIGGLISIFFTVTTIIAMVSFMR